MFLVCQCYTYVYVLQQCCEQNQRDENQNILAFNYIINVKHFTHFQRERVYCLMLNGWYRCCYSQTSWCFTHNNVLVVEPDKVTHTFLAHWDAEIDQIVLMRIATYNYFTLTSDLDS